MFEWDERRREENLGRYGVDFVRAARIYESPVLEREDDRIPYGERRYMALGCCDGLMLVVTWTLRGQRRHILAAWRADGEDEAIYRAAIPRASVWLAGRHPRRRALPTQPRRGLLEGGLARLSLPKPQTGPSSAGS